MSVFYLFGVGALLSSLIVITSKNPIHSIFALVVSFANVSILLILLGVEFLGLLFLIVYVGAIAILFLFVVMMLNIKLVELLDNSTRYIPIGFLIGIIFYVELTLLLPSINGDVNVFSTFDFFNVLPFNNILLIAEFLYTDFSYLFLFASLILLVAMLAAIVLTLSHSIHVKRQDLFVQINTDYHKTIKKC